MTDFRFPKDNRLLKPAEFKMVFNNPIFKIHQPYLMAFVSGSKTQHARLGMAITKKKVPKAVKRNLIKRVIREQFRHKKETLPPVDMVFIIKKPPTHLSKQQLSAEVANILAKTINKANNHAK